MSTVRKYTFPRTLTVKQCKLVKALDGMGDQAYLNAIFREVNQSGKNLIDLGAIHIVLNRLKLSGVLETYELTSDEFADGRSRRVIVYRLTSSGRRVYDESRAMLLEVGSD